MSTRNLDIQRDPSGLTAAAFDHADSQRAAEKQQQWREYEQAALQAQAHARALREMRQLPGWSVFVSFTQARREASVDALDRADPNNSGTVGFHQGVRAALRDVIDLDRTLGDLDRQVRSYEESKSARDGDAAVRILVSSEPPTI